MTIGLTSQEMLEHLSKTSLSREDRFVIVKLIGANNIAIRNSIQDSIKKQKESENKN